MDHEARMEGGGKPKKRPGRKVGGFKLDGMRPRRSRDLDPVQQRVAARLRQRYMELYQVYGVTAEQIWDCVGTQKASFYNHIKGQTVPRPAMLQKYADCMWVPLAWLYAEKEEPAPAPPLPAVSGARTRDGGMEKMDAALELLLLDVWLLLEKGMAADAALDAASKKHGYAISEALKELIRRCEAGRPDSQRQGDG